MEVRRPGPLDVGAHVGEQELQALELADRLAELLALPGVRDGVRQRRLGDAGRHGGDAEPAGVEGADSATRMPAPSSPIRWAAGIRAPSKITWVVTSQARPIFFSGAPKDMPGGVGRDDERATARGAGRRPVRAKRM